MPDLHHGPAPGEMAAAGRLPVAAPNPAPVRELDPTTLAIGGVAAVEGAARGPVASAGAAGSPTGPGPAHAGRPLLPDGARGMAALLGIQRMAGNRAATSAVLRTRAAAGTGGPTAPSDPASGQADSAGAEADGGEGLLSAPAVPGEAAPVGADAGPRDASPTAGAGEAGVQRLASTGLVVQRSPDSKEVRDEGLARAISKLNSNGTVKLVWAAVPKGTLADGMVEVKKYDVTVEGSASFTAKGLTTPTPTTGGTSTAKTRTAEGDKAAEWADVFAAEIKGKADPLMPAALAGMVTYRLAAEKDPGKETVSTKFGLTISGQYVEGTATFNPIVIDTRTKTLKPPTITVKVTPGPGLIEIPFESLLTVSGYPIDAKVKAKVSGSVQIGANWDKLAAALAEKFGKEKAASLLQGNLAEIAIEDADKAVSELAREMADEACRDIPDDVTRQAVMQRAEKAARDEAMQRGLPDKLAELEMRGLEEGELAAARSKMQAQARDEARRQMADFKETLGKRVLEEVKTFGRGAGLRELGKRISAKEAELVKEATRLADEAFEALVREIAEEATKDIAEKELREKALEQAKQHITVELESRGLRSEAIIAAERAAKSAALKSTIKDAAAGALKATISKIRTEIIEATIKKVAGFSLRTAVSKLALELAGGPIDFVLNGIELIAMWLDAVIKDQEVKVAGLTAVRMKDNFVQAYSRALMGPVAGTGQQGGGDNPEGQAYLAGANAGAQNYAEIIKKYTSPQVPQSDLEQMLKDRAISVDASKINAMASSKVKELLFSAYAKKHKGWFEDEADVLKSKDFQEFRQVVESNLDKNGRLTWARLANGVNVKLIALDSTSDRAQEFRTGDGRYSGVTIRGETETHSGWITADGTPLEDIYRAQGEADVANAGDQDRLSRGAQQLAASTIAISASMLMGPTPQITGASIQGPARDDPAFVDYLHEADALGRTLAGCGAKIQVSGPLPSVAAGPEPGGEWSGVYVLVAVGGEIQRVSADSVDFQLHKGAAATVRAAGFDPGSAGATDAYVRSTWATYFAGRTLASLPKLI